MKIAFCQQKSAASRVKDAALLVQVLSGSLFDALGSTARLKLLLETTAGLEAGDRGRLQTAGDLGLGIGVSLRLAGTHLKAAKASDGDLFVGTQAIGDLVKQCIYILLERPKVTSFGKFCVDEYNKCSPSLRGAAHKRYIFAHEVMERDYFL